MKHTNKILKILRILFYVVVCLFVFDILDVFQTKIKLLKAFVYYSVLLLPIPLLVMEFLVNKSLGKPLARKAIPSLVIVGVLYLNPQIILFHTQPWQTLSAVLVHENNENRKVEIQSKDIGALGYARRKVEVYYLTKHFYVVKSKNYGE